VFSGQGEQGVVPDKEKEPAEQNCIGAVEELGLGTALDVIDTDVVAVTLVVEVDVELVDTVAVTLVVEVDVELVDTVGVELKLGERDGKADGVDVAVELVVSDTVGLDVSEIVAIIEAVAVILDDELGEQVAEGDGFIAFG